MEIALVDVNKDDFANEFAPIDKIREKNRPTFFLRDNDTLLNLHPTILQDFTPLSFKNVVNKLKPLVIKSEADMCRHLSKGGLDHVTIVYYNSIESDRCRAADQEKGIALRVLQHHTEGQILRVEDKALAESLKLEENKVYMYYKPSMLIDQSRSYLKKNAIANTSFI